MSSPKSRWIQTGGALALLASGMLGGGAYLLLADTSAVATGPTPVSDYRELPTSDPSSLMG